jgi:putative endonuclease
VAFYTYIMASGPQGTLYVGQTDDLGRRVFEHKEKALGGFTARYGVDKLVWFEIHEERDGAKLRERQIKEWKRAWKIRLIEAENSRWLDLTDNLNNLIAY